MRIPLCTALLVCGLAMAQDRAPSRPYYDSSLRTPLQAQKADELLDRANFVFIGTVMQTRASNLSSVASGPQTTLVRVDKVLQGTSLLAESVGQVLTVRSLRASEHQPGQASTFFLDVDAFGEHLSGVEIGRFTLQGGDADRHPQVLASARSMREDRQLNRRMQMAEQVVQGRVVSVEPADINEHVSEHAARWYKAVVEVQTVIKGQPGTKTVTMYFPTSEDKVWRDAPRFSLGQEGVWLLHAKPMDYSRKSAMLPGLTALDPRDFQHADQVQRLQQLISVR